MPDSEAQKIGPNDFYRLENKMGFALYLQSQGVTYEQFIARFEQEEDNKFFRSLDRRCFYLFGNKKQIN